MSENTRTVFLESGAQTLELQKYTLTVQNGPNQGLTKSFKTRQVEIGTAPDTELILDDETVSRIHAKILVDENGYALIDMESKNGTYINGLRANEVYLENGSVFKLGETEIKFSLSGEEVEVHFSGSTRFGNLLGTSLEMREIFAMLERVAPTDATVLIEGESGTGKELFADAVHRNSNRKDGPFIIVDCSAIARDLIESELFGHVKGAFTGANSTRDGAFLAANGGTLFLDELGELPIDLQPKLLRALESRAVKPVGGNETVKCDVRIIAATNRNLIHEVKEGNFREDLYYRFAVIKVAIPPLRDRTADIAPLVESFIASASKASGQKAVDISYKTMEKLKRHSWPGNVRELKNFVERAVILTQDNQIETKFLNANASPKERDLNNDGSAALATKAIAEDVPFKEAKNHLIESFEKSYWKQLLEHTGGNISKAARIAGVHRKSVEYILKKLDLTRTDLG